MTHAINKNPHAYTDNQSIHGVKGKLFFTTEHQLINVELERD